jgi:hypothetical protein
MTKNIRRTQAGRLAQPSEHNAPPPPVGQRAAARSPLQQDGPLARRQGSTSSPMALRSSLPSPGTPSYSWLLNSPRFESATPPDEHSVSRAMQGLSDLMHAGEPSSKPSSQAGPSHLAGPSAVRGASPASSTSEASTSSESTTSTASSGEEEPANDLEALGYRKKQIEKLT